MMKLTKEKLIDYQNNITAQIERIKDKPSEYADAEANSWYFRLFKEFLENPTVWNYYKGKLKFPNSRQPVTIKELKTEINDIYGWKAVLMPTDTDNRFRQYQEFLNRSLKYEADDRSKLERMVILYNFADGSRPTVKIDGSTIKLTDGNQFYSYICDDYWQSGLRIVRNQDLLTIFNSFIEITKDLLKK